METVDLVIEELPQTWLYGIKIPEFVLDEKKLVIDDVRKLLKLEKSYVIGYDTKFMKSRENPHYHIHFADSRNIEALRKWKMKAMHLWGKAVKLYQAKTKKISDPNAWYGYAVKELNFFTSPDLDYDKIHNQSIIQLAFKQSKLDWMKKKDEKEEEKTGLKQRLFSFLAETPGLDDFRSLVGPFQRAYFEEVKKLPCKSIIESYIWEYLISSGLKTYEERGEFLFPSRNY